MSNRTINTGIGLNNIVAPNLNDIGYARNLNDTFENINDNFLMLANNNFVQGARGESVKLLEVDIYNKETSKLTAYGEMILNAIKPEGVNNVDYEPITISEKVINWYDNLYDEERSGKLYLIADDTGNVGESEVIISSLYYTFIDARYSAEAMGTLNPDVYSTKRDTSCILMWDAAIKGFKTLNNAFPTIYYEKGVGLCWKINGTNTGMPVKGLPGDNGASAVLQIVQCNELKYSDDHGVLVGEVTSAFDTYAGYVVLEEDKKKELNGSSVIVFAPLPKPDYIESDDKTYYLERGFCFGQCIYDDTTGKVMVYCHDDSIVDRSFDINSINNVFKSISAYNVNIAKGLSGLFIPIDSINDTDKKQAVHLLTALKSTEAIEDASSKALELTLLPINDIDSFQKAENPINIEKYLYLNVKPGMIDYDEAKNNLEKPCKFKLVEIITNAQSNYLKPYSSTNTIGSRVYKGSFTEADTVCIENENPETYSNNIFNLIPKKFKDAIEANGLYCWQIANGANPFDPIDSYAPGTSAASIFNAIFTIDLIPSNESEFLWFNGCQYADKSNPPTVSSGNYAGKYIIPGWTTDAFEFYKYIPIFTSSDNFKSNENVSLNVDYNINVSGDNNISKRSISVNGNVNCEVLSSDIISANKEFKNIYTKDEIISEKGILLGYNSVDHTSTISMYDNGDITTDGDIVTNAITAKTNINTNKLSVLGQDDNSGNNNNDGTIITNNVIVGSFAKPSLLNISTKPQVNTIDINIDNVENIDISRYSTSSSIITDSNVIVKKGGILSVTNNDVIATGINADINSSGEATSANDDYWMTETFDELKYKEIKSLFDNTSLSSPFSMTEKTKSNVNGSSFYQNAGVIYYDNVKQTNELKLNFNYDTPDDSNITDYKNRKALQFILCPANSTYKFDQSTITIQLAKMGFAMGLYSHCSNGKWPVLVDDSNMHFRVAIEYGDSTPNIEFECTDKYKFNNSLKANKIVDDCSYAWTTGYTTEGTPVNGSNYEGWRYKIYHVSPYNITISDPKILSNIKKCYDSGNQITISVYPEFYIHVKAQNGYKNVCDDVKIYRMYEVGNNTSRSYTITEQSGWNGNACNGNIISVISKIKYKLYNQYDSAVNINTASLCNDGIVIKHGNTVFGLGFAEKATNYYYNGRTDKDYERDENNKGFYKSYDGVLKNEPILFYYTTVNDTSSTNKNKYASNHAQYINTIDENNVQMMINSITLREIFELVKHAKSIDTWKRFGL